MTVAQSVFLLLQALVSGVLALFAGVVVGFVILRQTGFVPPRVEFGPVVLAGDWPPFVFAIVLCLVAVVSSVRSYRRKVLAKSQDLHREPSQAAK